MAENKEVDDGGPAFPEHSADSLFGSLETKTPGMSLRDYLAAHALQGILANVTNQRLEEVFSGIVAGGTEARIAYTYADAMIRESKRVR